MARPTPDPDDDRWKGRPASFRPEMYMGGNGLRWLWHPVAYVRWRAEVRRSGPFAPNFDEFRRR